MQYSIWLKFLSMKGHKAWELSAHVARQRGLQHDLPGGLYILLSKEVFQIRKFLGLQDPDPLLFLLGS